MKSWKTVKRVLSAVIIGSMLSLGGVLSPFIPTPIASAQVAQQVTSQQVLKANKIIRLGLKYIGTPYVFGARAGQTKSFDCSSFTQYVYGKYGISLPRLANAQKRVGKTVSFNQLKKGDLMFFHTGYRSVSNNPNRADHVGIYMGNNKILHATPGGKGVKVSKINSYWKKTFITGKRVIR